MILADTGPLVALFDPKDRSHEHCIRLLRTLREPLRTTIPVLTEAFHLLGPASGGSAALRQFLSRGGMSIAFMDRATLQRAFGAIWIGRDGGEETTSGAIIETARLGTWVQLLETAVIVREIAISRRLVRALQDAAPELVFMQDSTAVARHLGAAAALLGDIPQAEAYYRQALEVCAKIRFRPEIALTRLGLAELLLEHHPDRRAEAVAHLDFAIEEFRAMGMAPSLERALKDKGLLEA